MWAVPGRRPVGKHLPNEVVGLLLADAWSLSAASAPTPGVRLGFLGCKLPCCIVVVIMVASSRRDFVERTILYNFQNHICLEPISVYKGVVAAEPQQHSLVFLSW